MSTENQQPTEQNSIPIASITQTHQTSVTVERTWTIDHFSFYIDLHSKRPLLSAPIYLDPHCTIILALYPNGDRKANSDYISLHLRYTGTISGSSTLPLCQFYIIDSRGRYVNYNFCDQSSPRCQFIARSKLLNAANGYLQPNDQLKIYCKITFTSATTNLPSSDDLQGYSYQSKSLLDSGIHSDFIISIGDVELPVHKAILGLRSAVFEAMFEQKDTKEAVEGKAIIEDVDLATFKVLLEYLYTGVIPEKGKLTEELLVAANKYLVDPLKLACEEHLSSSTLTPDSAIKLLQLADTCNTSKLKATILHFIVANAAQVMATSDWKALLDTRRQLADEALDNIAFKMEEFRQLLYVKTATK